MFGGNAPALPIDVARDQFPNHHFDVCAAADITPYVTVEENDFGDHLYEPSDKQPDDAIRPLCRKCLGTHGEDGGREVITVRTEPQQSTSGLILPSGVQADSGDQQ